MVNFFRIEKGAAMFTTNVMVIIVMLIVSLIIMGGKICDGRKG